MALRCKLPPVPPCRLDLPPAGRLQRRALGGRQERPRGALRLRRRHRRLALRRTRRVPRTPCPSCAKTRQTAQFRRRGRRRKLCLHRVRHASPVRSRASLARRPFLRRRASPPRWRQTETLRRRPPRRLPPSLCLLTPRQVLLAACRKPRGLCRPRQGQRQFRTAGQPPRKRPASRQSSLPRRPGRLRTVPFRPRHRARCGGLWCTRRSTAVRRSSPRAGACPLRPPAAERSASPRPVRGAGPAEATAVAGERRPGMPPSIPPRHGGRGRPCDASALAGRLVRLAFLSAFS